MAGILRISAGPEARLPALRGLFRSGSRSIDELDEVSGGADRVDDLNSTAWAQVDTVGAGAVGRSRWPSATGRGAAWSLASSPRSAHDRAPIGVNGTLTNSATFYPFGPFESGKRGQAPSRLGRFTRRTSAGHREGDLR
ncbi:hypothetical protein GCM10010404_63220 [Nonomuraea africana]